MELNAMISELWRYFLEQKTEGWFLSTDFKYSTIGKKYAEIEQLKYNFEHDINNTYEVMEFIHMYQFYRFLDSLRSLEMTEERSVEIIDE